MTQNCILNMNLKPGVYEHTKDLAGRAVRLVYASGHTLEQHWQSDSRVKWKGIEGGLAGYDQYESYHAFKIRDDLYWICWVEEATAAIADGPQIQGPWLTDVILDFGNMCAMASWTGPTADGGSEHVLDQASISFVEIDAD